MRVLSLDEWSAPLRELVEAELDQVLPPADLRPERLHQAMRYSALAPGKRIRPLLCFAAAEACGSPPQHVLPTACAIECIHAFSLIHDDLPALDDDDLRRGQPTCHRAFDEATAILAGDALFAFAFDLAARNRATASAASVLQVMALLASAAGGMVAGQAVDIESESVSPAPEAVDFIHENKTGALIRASVLSAGLLSLPADEKLKALAEYGTAVGKAFQIADDVLNATADEQTLGKPVGSDAEHRKMTYVALYGVERSREIASDLADKALAAAEGFGAAGEPLRLLCRYATRRDR